MFDTAMGVDYASHYADKWLNLKKMRLIPGRCFHYLDTWTEII